MAGSYLRPPSLTDQYSDQDDEIFLTDGLYAKLHCWDTYGGYGDEEDSYDDISDEEGGLDLSAPPPES